MISYDERNRMFKLDTPHTSYVFGVEDDFGFLIHYYYGRKINDTDLRYLGRYDAYPFVPSHNARDEIGFLDTASFEYPTGGIGDYREHCLEIKTDGGHNMVKAGFESFYITKGKEACRKLPETFGNSDDVSVLHVVLRDSFLNLKIVLHYGVFEDCDVITRSVSVVNEAETPIYLTKVLSACLDMENRNFDLLTLNGNWASERRIELEKVSHRSQYVSSRKGATGHQSNPFIALTTLRTNQTAGDVFAMNLVYSGNFSAGTDMNSYDNVRAMIGIDPYNFSWKLSKGETFEAPEAVLVYSDEGLGKMTRTYHDLYRNHLIRSPYVNTNRPVLINNWEATYFNFDTDKLLSIAKMASELGIEMLVMDDGWFGQRNDDNSALGDWVVNEDKLPGGLGALADSINKLGMKFGIWMEPEMVSKDSDLFRAHPDWAIQVPGRTPELGRNQLVLDITRSEVLEYVWNSIKNVLDSANIEYLKWDMNRQLTNLGSKELSGDCGGELYHRYVLGVYELQGRLIKEYPNLLLENCAGGGGRFDPGMLFFSPQIWCSDDTDAIERLTIQEGTELVYPLSTMGAHVSDCPNHIVGRTTPFATRGNVALAGTFGYELDITRISKEDRDMIPKQIEMYHEYSRIVRLGDYYRLASFRENQTHDAWMVKTKDGGEFVVTFVNVMQKANSRWKKIYLQGLNPDERYLCHKDNRIYGGDVLMNAGFIVKGCDRDYSSEMIYFTRVD